MMMPLWTSAPHGQGHSALARDELAAIGLNRDRVDLDLGSYRRPSNQTWGVMCGEFGSRDLGCAALPRLTSDAARGRPPGTVADIDRVVGQSPLATTAVNGPRPTTCASLVALPARACVLDADH
jgi:hypothetical protein